MKKKIAVVLLTILCVLCLGGCAKYGECEECGQKEKLNKYVDAVGDVIWLCDDCYKWYKFLY